MKFEEVEVNSERWFDLTLLLNEEFRDIKGLDGRYQISNYGRVKSVNRITNYIDGRVRHNKEKIKKNQINKKGKEQVIYYSVKLDKNKIFKNYEIHRLVAETFIPNPDNKPTVDHINPVSPYKCNNRIDNLRWATYSEQQRNSFDNCGKVSPMKGKINTYNCKKVEQYNLIGDKLNVFLSIHDVERKLGYSYKCISRCCIENSKNNKIHTSYGYVWKYKED